MMKNVLESIQTPEQIQHLSKAEQNQLAIDLREVIIRQVSLNGGHLASNLGVIELTIALLATHDFRTDRIVFDVGHQSYAWKILTGRLNQFATLRQKNGLAGFPKRSESAYDFFDTGHSSTSISAALGMVRAMRNAGQSGRVFALIGDGALTGGMAFEALNDAGMSGAPLVVILNDNQMSISKNVGGMSKHLENLRISRRYIHLKTIVENILLRIPWFGERLLKLLQHIKQLDRVVLRRSGVLFEQLGFHYYGPVDGHDLTSLNRHLKNISEIKGPVLLHVMTQKGKGYSFAESAPDIYHGVAPFEVEHGVCAVGDSSCTNYSDIFGQTVLAAALQQPAICTITAAMTSGTGLQKFAELLPLRFYDVGIAEQHAMTLAAGLAAGGARPVLALYSTFLQRAYDQLLHDVCLQNLPVVLGIDRAGIVGEDGETHQGIYDLNLLLTLPNIEIICPADGDALKSAIPYALNQNHPVALRYPRGAAHRAKSQLDPNNFEPQIVCEGQDCTLVVLGTLLNSGIDTAKQLKQNHVTCEVISVQAAKPIDLSLIIASVKKTGYLIIAEETVAAGGFGNSILPDVLTQAPTTRFKLVAIADEPLHQGTRSQLLHDHHLDIDGLCLEVMALLS
ncbi:MAG: 1-deoxy-D-xylulose-5-phosphate synthase [Eubacteriales bacterium]|nr:1-deoxy-D-xylulose-5-phosphate synthase [Eubacteriales bacterium]